jgi:hypothetical protein
MKRTALALTMACWLAASGAVAEPEPGFRADLDGDTWAELFDLTREKWVVSLAIRRPDLGVIEVPEIAFSTQPPVMARAGERAVTLKTRPVWSHPNFVEHTLTISYVNNAYVVSRWAIQTTTHGRARQVSTCDLNLVTGRGTASRPAPARSVNFTVPAGAPEVSTWRRTQAVPAPCR